MDMSSAVTFLCKLSLTTGACPGISGRGSSYQIQKPQVGLQITSGNKKVHHPIPSQKAHPKILRQKLPSFSSKKWCFSTLSTAVPSPWNALPLLSSFCLVSLVHNLTPGSGSSTPTLPTCPAPFPRTPHVHPHHSPSHTELSWFPYHILNIDLDLHEGRDSAIFDWI